MIANVDTNSREFLLGNILGANCFFIEMVFEGKIDSARFKSFHDSIRPVMARLGLNDFDLAMLSKEYCESVGHQYTDYFNLIESLRKP